MNKDHRTITIFGASGRTGREIIELALNEGFHIRAVVRLGGKFAENRQNVEIFYCGLKNNKETEKAVIGTDCVVIVFGPNPPYTEVFCADCTKQIVESMQKENVKRLVCQTGAMIGSYRENRSFFFEKFSQMFRKNYSESYRDRLEQEEIIKKSPLDWTIIKPPRLTNGPLNSNLAAGPDMRVGLLSSVSRKSLARFIIKEIISPRYIRKTVFVRK